MEEELITFDTGVSAKEKGFDWKVTSRYNDNELINPGSPYNHNSKDEQTLWNVELTSAPTQSLLQKWLREKYLLFVLVDWTGMEWNYKFNGTIKGIDKTYEKALEKGLQEALKLIEK